MTKDCFFDEPIVIAGRRLARYEKVEIRFLIKIDMTGKFLDLIDTGKPSGKRIFSETFIVPMASVYTRRRDPTYFLYDDLRYVLGYPCNPKSK